MESNKKPLENNYPQELLDATYIEDGYLHTSLEITLESIKQLIRDHGIRSEADDTVEAERGLELAVHYYIANKSQQEIYEELYNHPNENVAEGAKHLDPRWKPLTKSNYDLLCTHTSKMAELNLYL